MLQERKTISRALFLSATGAGWKGGGALCSLAFLQAVSKLFSGRVTFVGPPIPDDLPLPCGLERIVRVDQRSWLDKVRGVVTGRAGDRLFPFWERRFANYLGEDLMVFLNGSAIGRYAPVYAQRGIPVATIFHNVELHYFQAQRSRNPVTAWHTRIVVANEVAAYRHSKVRIFLTGYDADYFDATCPEYRAAGLTVGGLYFGTWDPGGEVQRMFALQGDRRRVLVTCSLGVAQNVPGVVWFLEDVWPRVVAGMRGKEVELVVAGGVPHRKIVRAAQRAPRTRLVAQPDPATMDRLFAEAAVAVSTIDEGSGIKLRVSEALRRGLPVVCSEHSRRGFESVSSRVLREYHSAEECAAALVDLCSVPDTAELRRAARAEYDRLYQFDVGLERLRHVLIQQGMLNAEPPTRS